MLTHGSFKIKIILILPVVVVVLMPLYEYISSGRYDGYPSLWKILQIEEQGCKELAALSPKDRQRTLRSESPKDACVILFFETRKIDTPVTFLTGKQFQAYKDYLAKNECLKAEQILWLRYKATYSGTPKVNFAETYDGPRGRWRYYVLASQVPEVVFCIYKKRFETNQKQILNKRIRTKPITDIFKIYKIKSINEFEGERNRNLTRIVSLMRFDYAPAQIFIIQQSIKGDVFTLIPREQYRLLKRLEMLDNLPEELRYEFVKVRQKLPTIVAYEIDRKLASYSFFLISSMPTMASEER